MSLKTTNQIAIEKAHQHPKNKNLILLGKPDLASTENPLISSLFDEEKFFYIAEQRQGNFVYLKERGIGYLIKGDNNFELVRSEPLGFYAQGDPNISPCLNGPIDFSDHLTVYSSYPFSLLETLCEDYSVPACDFKSIPKNIALSKFSFLGRLDDGVTSISLDNLKDCPEIQEALVGAVTGYTKQIALSATKLNMKSRRGVISSNIFQLNPTNNPPAKKGTLIYDENDDLLKYYDGNSWRSLSFTKDDLS